MRLAIEVCREGLALGQTPFGAVIERGGEVLARAHNRVWLRNDPTAHAEIEAIREACARLGTIDLQGASIYSTTEPCPMCFAAIHWARIGRIVSGATIDDAAHAGFHELRVSNAELRERGELGDLELHPGVLQAECRALFTEFASRSPGRVY